MTGVTRVGFIITLLAIGIAALVAVLAVQTVRAAEERAYADQMRSIRDERYKLIEYNIPTGRRSQLFDTVTDPEEMNDLSARADQQATLESLRRSLKEAMMRADDPLVEIFV